MFHDTLMMELYDQIKRVKKKLRRRKNRADLVEELQALEAELDFHRQPRQRPQKTQFKLGFTGFPATSKPKKSRLNGG